MKRAALPILFLAALAAPVPSGAVDKEKAEYVSGPFDTIEIGTEGALSAAADKLVFVAEGAGGLVEIPWPRVLDVEYSQTRTGLFKTRHHFVSFVFRDEGGAERRLMLELGKNIILGVLDSSEQQTGRRVVYRDEEAARYRLENAPFSTGG